MAGKIAFASVVLAASLFCGMALASESELLDATDPEEILNIARGFGAATLGIDSVGDPQVTGRIDGNAYTIFFYGCTDGRDCTNLQFSSGWISDDVDLNMINSWNRGTRFARAYLDDEDDPILEMDVNLEFGVSRRNFDDTFMLWAANLDNFAAFIQAK
jgi:hypothetical protein